MATAAIAGIQLCQMDILLVLEALLFFRKEERKI